MDDFLMKYMDDANLPEAEADTSTPEDTTATEDEGQGEEATPTPTEEASPVEKELDSNEVKPTSDILSVVESLGITRNGLPAEFKDENHVKELLSKGYDYTVKTQELAELRKQFETEQQTKSQEIESKIKEVQQYEQQVKETTVENKVLINILQTLQQSDPATFAELETMYNAQMDNYRNSVNNPQVQELHKTIKGLEEKINGISGQAEEQQKGKINQEWDTGLAEVQKQWGAKLKSMGIKTDWTKVQKAWASDRSNSLSVRAALLAVHGEEITKALESEKKLLKTKQASAQRGAPVKNTPVVTPKTDSEQGHNSSYLDYLKQLAEQHAS